MTTDQLVEIMKHLSEDDLECLKRQLEMLIRDKNRHIPDEEKVQRGWDQLLQLSGCVDLGLCRVPNPDREWIYNERIDDLS